MNIKMKELLQRLYDSCNWKGYAYHNGKTYHEYRLQQIANRLKISLEYNCPA